LGGDTHKLISLVSDVLTRPWLKKRLWKLARSFGSVGAAYLLVRTLMVAAYDQPSAAVLPEEAYVPIAGFEPEYPVALVDLTRHESFFYDYEREDGSIDEAMI